MKALKIYETLEFKQGGDPYKKLKIGAHRKFKDSDIIQFNTYVWAHFPDGNMCVNCRNAEFRCTTKLNDKNFKIPYPYHLIVVADEKFQFEIINGKDYWKPLNRTASFNNFDPEYGFPEWVQENPEAYTIIKR